MRVSSYLLLPKELKAKWGCLNNQNNDEKCFLWSILASLHPVQHRNSPSRVSKYQEYKHDLNMSGVKYPVDIKDIGKFEHQDNISANVYGYEDKKIFPLFIIYHCWRNIAYVSVKDLRKLVSSQYNNNYHKKYFCQYFLHGCTSEKVLKNYLGRCKLHKAQRIKLPEADNKKGRDKVKFPKTEYQLRLPFVIYADFESVLCKRDLCEPSSSKSFTIQHQQHVPCGSCNYVKRSDGGYFETPQVNIGDDAAEKFLDQVFAAATICRQHLVKIPMKRLTQEQWREYINATNCSICTKPFM